MAFRRAHTLRKGKAVIVDESKTIEEGIEHFSEEAKRREIDRKARRKQKRERDKAARQWWKLEDDLVLPIHDLHYGKYATREEVGANYKREIASERAYEAVDAVLEQALRVP